MAYDVLKFLKELAKEGDPLIGCPEDKLLEKNWLTKGNAIINFLCPTCKTKHKIEISRRVPDELLRKHKFLCGCIAEELQVCSYAGAEPRSVNIMYKTTFEKNGRKGIRTQLPNGKQLTRSVTKENAMTGKGNDSILTKGCHEASNKAKKEIEVNREKQMMAEILREAAVRSEK